MALPDNPKRPSILLDNLVYSKVVDEFLKAVAEDHSHLWHATAITINGVDFNWSDLRTIASDFDTLSRVADSELHVQKRELSRMRAIMESVQTRRWKAIELIRKAREQKDETVDRVELEKSLGVPQPVDKTKRKV